MEPVAGDTDRMETDRLLLRRFSGEDAEALLAFLGDPEVNEFLPMFPLRDAAEAERYLRYIGDWIRQGGLYYAICLKGKPEPVGCVHVSGDDSRDLGYALGRAFWNRGICTEACRAVIARLKRTGAPYVTATHDVNNPRSGAVMRAVGMTYRYSYEELWQPKNRPVTFRMYQLDLNGRENETYRKYWDRHPVHFVENP